MSEDVKNSADKKEEGLPRLEISEIYRAAAVLRDVARHTKLMAMPLINPDVPLYIKPENMQHTGAFKLRGAYYKISQLTPEERAKGVIACSAGNHAQGVALAATHNGIRSLICLPAGAPISKIEATKRLGAEVCLVPGVYDDAYQKAVDLQKEHGYTFIHPFDDPKVIAGQGTIALEILEDMPDVEAVVVPIGGGGLIGGIAFALKQLKPEVKVYGVQAKGAPSMAESVEKGERVHLDQVATVADGIAVKEPGRLTFDLCEKYVDEIVTVSDDEIAAAILALIEQQRLVAEGAGAVAVAAVMFNKLPLKDVKTVALVSGGNIDVTNLNRVITRGLVKSGRIADLRLEVRDQPAVLSSIANILGALGANILSVHHERHSASKNINDCIVHIEAETRNAEHIAAIEKALTEAGHEVVLRR